jgi:hypothetical protein
MKYSEYIAVSVRLSNRLASEDLTKAINEKLAEGWHFVSFAPSERADTPMILFGKPT